MPELITNVGSFETLIKNENLTIIHFYADWVEQCAQVNDVLDTLAKEPDYANTKFCKCQAEELPEISFKYQIEAVPTVLYYRSGNLVDRVDGTDVSKITSKVKQHSVANAKSRTLPPSGDNKVALEERLKQLINRHKVVLFMKGDRVTPRCGFSKQTINILNETGVAYDTFDILTDEEVRQGLKTYSDWPTYPQLYVNGDLIGGLDIIKEMLASNDLISTLNA